MLDDDQGAPNDAQQDDESQMQLAGLGLTQNSTWGSRHNVPADGDAPSDKSDDDDDDDETSAEQPPSASQDKLPKKIMKTASKALQFYHTIVVTVCANVKEWNGVVKAYERGILIFKKVECALRDRIAFPLPDNVSLKDLLDNSYFKGAAGDEEFRKYCVDCKVPLTENMVAHADRLFANKFSDTLKIIRNHVLPKFLHIMKELNGKTGKKSG